MFTDVSFNYSYSQPRHNEALYNEWNCRYIVTPKEILDL